jgi:GDPmannose 4,6-dehydratase
MNAPIKRTDTPRRALISGITGQDGSYLAEFLIGKGYEVYGMVRRSSSFNTGRIDHLYQDPHENEIRLRLLYGDLNDASSLNHILRKVHPHEIYNLGAQEEGIDCRFYQASSSELFGMVHESPQNESTPFYPRSPYAAAKAYAFHITRNYREAYDLFACNGILFNHESPRRGETFVTRKITRAAARIKLGLQDKLFLGNLDAKRDWGFAGDYVEAMWLMLQADKPEDYVIATGETHTVREFLDETFRCLELDPERYVEIDPRYFRPTEVDMLLGDASKAREQLGWTPRVGFNELVKMMVEADLRLAEAEKRMGVEPGQLRT